MDWSRYPAHLRPHARVIGLILCLGVSPAYGTSILMLGDSITFGISSPPVGPGFAELAAEALSGTHEVEISGCGGSGAFSWRPTAGPVVCLGHTTDRVVLFDTFVDPATPYDVVSVMLGTNDASLGFGVAAYRLFLAEIFQGLLDVGSGLVLALTPPPRPGDNLAAQERTRQYADAIRDPGTGLCHTMTGVICGPDVFNLLDVETDFAQANVHPNAFGHVKIANALVESITAIPEPSTLVSLGFGVGWLSFVMRSQRCRASAPPARRRPS